MSPVAALAFTCILLGTDDRQALTAGSPGSPPAPASSAGAREQVGRDRDSPPPGSPEDQALWKAGHEASNQIVVDRNLATRLQLRAKIGGYQERLDALAKRGPDEARRAASLKQEYLEAWSESFELLTRQWPVDPTRGCQYPLLTFESALYANDGPKKAPELPSARSDLRQCVEAAGVVLGAVTRSNKRFEGVLSDLDRELPPAGPASREAAPDGGPAGAPAL